MACVFYIGRAKSVNKYQRARQRVGWGRGEWGIDNLVLRVVAILILVRTRWLMLWVPSAFWLGRAQPGSSTLRPPMVANSLTWRLAWHGRSVFPGRADGFASRLRCERCGKNAVALNRLGGCRAPEAAAEGALAFHHKGRPHLLDSIWETDLEDAPVIVLNGTSNPSSVRFQNCSFPRSKTQRVFGPRC